MKKLMAAIIAATLIFSPVGHFVFHDHNTTAEAKSYKSGKRSFNTGTRSNTPSLFQNKKTNNNTTYNQKTTSRPKTSGFMKGLMFGGLAGLLFGGLFSNMGMLGSLMGLVINVLAIMFLISLIRGIFTLLIRNRRTKDNDSWRR